MHRHPHTKKRKKRPKCHLGTFGCYMLNKTHTTMSTRFWFYPDCQTSWGSQYCCVHQTLVKSMNKNHHPKENSTTGFFDVIFWGLGFLWMSICFWTKWSFVDSRGSLWRIWSQFCRVSSWPSSSYLPRVQKGVFFRLWPPSPWFSRQVFEQLWRHTWLDPEPKWRRSAQMSVNMMFFTGVGSGKPIGFISNM